MNSFHLSIFLFLLKMTEINAFLSDDIMQYIRRYFGLIEMVNQPVGFVDKHCYLNSKL